ncbi:baseplate J/gp47 family protein [Atlantibacter hermannii]|uniref:baseplate J/gp47 family protein n=1 Tax=Atlantibacter hermannii TaxID=565 RepID=UPI0028AA8444|nr:baseplate J/gp47 family protein [Atlantibacter hermannii]MCQ4969190.1 baseplate J/gp47 family protein [Enterobacteriaceae bacterium DFI.7.85]
MALNLDTLGLSATVTAQGISAPDYQTIVDKLSEYFRQIYGNDAYLDPDSKDGQMLAIYALGIHDANNTSIAVYNSFSPSTGNGRALSSNVKINGITRKLATNSTADVVIEGDVGTQITAGSVRDANGTIWNLPASVIIPQSQSITVTAICSVSGPMVALPGTINRIATPTRGWRMVNNPTAATPGESGEDDVQLRERQTRSTALPSQTTMEGIDGALLEVSGVTRMRSYENDTEVTDSNGLPPHSLCCIVDGGDATEIARVIAGKKDVGTTTYGTTTVSMVGRYGEPKTIRFSRPSVVDVFVDIELTTYPGYTTSTADRIKAEVAKYINSLRIGDPVLLSRVYSPANLGVMSGGESRFYDITSLKIGKSETTTAASNIGILFDEAARGDVANIKVAAS